MKNTWIGRKLFWHNLLYLTCAITLVLLAILISVASRHYVYNAFAGPFPVDADDLGRLEDMYALHKYFVTLRPRAVARAGVTALLNGSPSTEYLYASDGKKVLLIRAHVNTEGTEFSGTLETNPPFIRQARETLSAQVPAVRDQLLPFALDAVLPIRWKGYAIVLLVIVFLFAACYLAWLAVRRTLNPLRHPYALALARHGSPTDVAASIDSEAAQATQVAGAFVSQNWVWRLVAFNLTVCRLDDLVWVYQMRTLNPSGKVVSVSLKLLDSDGVLIETTAPEADIVRLLNDIHQRVPWATSGFTEQLDQLWSDDRPAFLDEVKQRRAQHASPP